MKNFIFTVLTVLSLFAFYSEVKAQNLLSGGIRMGFSLQEAATLKATNKFFGEGYMSCVMDWNDTQTGATGKSLHIFFNPPKMIIPVPTIFVKVQYKDYEESGIALLQGSGCIGIETRTPISAKVTKVTFDEMNSTLIFYLE